MFFVQKTADGFDTPAFGAGRKLCWDIMYNLSFEIWRRDPYSYYGNMNVPKMVVAFLLAGAST